MRWAFLRGFECFVFLFVFPFAARLGGRVGRWIAGWVGRISFRLDVDWRTVSLEQHFVRGRTVMALHEIFPEASTGAVLGLCEQRFVCAAQEELDAHYFFMDNRLDRVCSFEGLEAVREVSSRSGLVFLTLHLDATLMGVTQLGKAGLKLNLMTSNIVEDARVPPSLRRFFRKKYEGIERHLNGGHYWHNETNLRNFYEALKRREGVVVLCEGPASSLESGLLTRFLGKQRALRRGALRLAERTGAAMVGMVCLRLDDERYKVVFSPVFEASSLKPDIAIHEIYAFLDQAVRASPERWWAADLLPTFINKDV
jgi:lauroyl/myristoyl acyltransferase